MNKKITSSVLVGSILASIIFYEGGYSDDPDDPGGKTKYGITERVAREYGYSGSIEDLTQEQANRIYTELYVDQPHFNLLLEISPAVGHKLIDAGVNVGTMRVSLWFQQTLNAFSRDGTDYKKIPEDGVIGKKTIEAYQALEKKRGKVKACELVLKALDGQQSSYYLKLTAYSKYTVGWVDNRVENIPLNQCKEYNLDILKPDTKNESR